MAELIIFTDGGSRNNPGQAAIGVSFVRDDQEVFSVSESIGIATNNVAEYSALLRSVEVLEEQSFLLKDVTTVTWHLDSKLVVEQVNKNWKVKDATLQTYVHNVWEKLVSLPCSYQITYVPRAQNKRADQLVNEALDAL